RHRRDDHLQRHARRRVAQRRQVLLRQPAGEQRQTSPSGVVRLCLLPAERRAVHRVAAGPRVCQQLRPREQDAQRLREPLRRRDGGTVKIEQITQYPWNGNVLLTVEPKAQQFALKLRIPGWCDASAVALSRDGQGVEVKVEKGYVTVPGPWGAKNVIELRLPME